MTDRDGRPGRRRSTASGKRCVRSGSTRMLAAGEQGDRLAELVPVDHGARARRSRAAPPRRSRSRAGSCGSPVRTTRPPGRTKPTWPSASSTASGVPAVSRTRSTPSRPRSAGPRPRPPRRRRAIVGTPLRARARARAGGPCARRRAPGILAPAGAGARAARASRRRRRPRSLPAVAPPGRPPAPRPPAARRRAARPTGARPAPASMPAPAAPPARRTRRPGRCRPRSARGRGSRSPRGRGRTRRSPSWARRPPGRPAAIRVTPGPDGHDVADELVSRDQRVADAPLPRPDAVVGPADPGGLDPDQRLARPDGRVANRLEAKGAGAREHRGPHGALSWRERHRHRSYPRYIDSMTSAYFARTSRRFTFRVGVSSPPSWVKSSGRTANRLTCA